MSNPYGQINCTKINVSFLYIVYVHKNTNLLLLLLVSIHGCLIVRETTKDQNNIHTKREMASKGFWRVVSQIHVSTAWTLKQEKTKLHKIQLMMGEKIPLLLNEQVKGWNPGRRKYCLFFPQISLSTTLASRYYTVADDGYRTVRCSSAGQTTESKLTERERQRRETELCSPFCVCVSWFS